MASATAVLAFVGTLSVVPYTAPNAYADQEFMATQDQRLHQQFVPATATETSFDLAASPIELVPEAKPKKVEKTETATDTSEQSAQDPAPAGAGAPPMYTGGGSPAEWMAAAGIAKSDWGYVDYIISHESTWNPNATNASSGACGLAQALPCSKVPGGNGYDPVANLQWASGYAVSRYGSWKGAYEAWTVQNWW
ncbi:MULTISPECIES: transglycosylase SLT domain-containing protein [Leucobacter]|uniref:Transglycosylase SLT domain-containing protein n=1 Tax=Leucobacter iarius TaxID=333963 RepID=A0ABN2LHV6_9MICO|nr:transglycosylase SLT domain-containing protein [Leucobacter sp. Ag1]